MSSVLYISLHVMDFRVDDLSGPEIAALLLDHLRSVALHSPPESVHALDLDGLRRPGVTLWTAWEDGRLLGCGALKELDARHAEIKSMKTSTQHLRRGVARRVLGHLLGEARKRGYRRLSLETGSMAAFEPARRLYEAFGFAYCGPFADYARDPHSVFMTLALDPPPLTRRLALAIPRRPSLSRPFARLPRESGHAIGYPWHSHVMMEVNTWPSQTTHLQSARRISRRSRRRKRSVCARPAGKVPEPEPNRRTGWLRRSKRPIPDA